MFNNQKINLLNRLREKNRRTDNSSIILFTNARDEPNIAEWVAHHLLLGFSKIVIFDHLSITPISSLINNDFNGRLCVLKVNGEGNIKVNLMNDALKMAYKGNYSWMIYLDTDEFINLNGYTNIIDFLNIFKEADSVGLNWLMFGTSGHKNQPKGLITENFLRSDLRLNQHVKSFVRPSVAVNAINPHYYIMKNPSRCYSGNGTRMEQGPFNNQPLPFINTRGYIAHYYTQSENEHKRRKSRLSDDGSVNKAAALPEVHKMYNDYVNNQLQNKYSGNIKNFLKNYGIIL